MSGLKPGIIANQRLLHSQGPVKRKYAFLGRAVLKNVSEYESHLWFIEESMSHRKRVNILGRFWLVAFT